MTKKFSGQTAFITGSTRGIGLGIARQFAAEGANLVIIGTHEEKARETAATLAGEFQVETLGCGCNVADADSVNQAVKAALARFGNIQILVNNAGITRDNLLIRMSEEEWDQVLSTNLKGVFNCVKAFSRPMMKARYGRIINISSVIALIGNTGQANYAAAKAGILGFTKSIARELASRNITVNAVAPGYIDTDMTRVLPEEAKNAILAQIPAGRVGKPDDIANAVLFLAEEASSYITGQVLAVSGGMTM